MFLTHSRVFEQGTGTSIPRHRVRRSTAQRRAELLGQTQQQASGNEASQELADAIYAHTEGNPFFMSEVIRLLGEESKLEEGSGSGGPVTLGIPHGVSEVIGQRLNRLSTECVQVLTTASIIGREFDFRLLCRLEAETSEDQMLALQAVDTKLAAMVGAKDAALWTESARREDPLWAEVRSLAMRVLVEFDWPMK